jgi:hypothetical protein
VLYCSSVTIAKRNVGENGANKIDTDRLTVRAPGSWRNEHRHFL